MSDVRPIRPKWKGTMSPRHRFNNQMHWKPVDRSFNMEFGYWDENFTEWPLFYENGITNNREADVFFNFDPIHGIGGVADMYPPIEEKVVSETPTTKVIMNHSGLLAEIPKDGHDTIPHFLKSSIQTPDDWKRIKEERFRRDDPARKMDIAALKAQYPDDRDYPFGIDCGSMIGRVRDMLTFEGLCYAIYDFPDMVEDMVETRCQLMEDALDQLLPHFQFDFASGWEDICFNHGPIVSVPFFRDVVMPRYKRLSARLSKHGIDLWYIDCDGDVRPILPFFLEGGVNCLFPYEVNSCTHPGVLLDQYKGVLRIMGGVDKMALGKGPKAIKAYLDTLVPYVERGGYIPFCDHRCPPNVKPEDYLYYLDLKEKMFGLQA